MITPHLLQFPPEIVYYLLSFLSIHDLLRLRETCILLRDISLCSVKDLNLRKYAIKITDPVLTNILSLCSYIQTLCISNCHVTDRVFSDIAQFCPRLTRLHAYNLVMTSSCLNSARVVLPRLRELTLGRGTSCVADEALQENDISMQLLEYGTHLLTLNLCFRTSRSLRSMRNGLSFLHHCDKIEKITIFTQLKVCSHDTSLFCKLPNLTTLLFASSQLTTGALAALNPCLRLSELYLHDVMVSENGMAALARIPQLARLFLVSVRALTDPGVAMLAKCQKLEGLEIIKSETLTDAGITPIAECKSLKIICLNQTPNISQNVKKAFQYVDVVLN